MANCRTLGCTKLIPDVNVWCEKHYKEQKFDPQEEFNQRMETFIPYVTDHQGEAIEIGPQGGAGSKIPRWELMDFRALDAIAQVFTDGAEKYAVDNWRACPWREHVRHQTRHAMASLELYQQYNDSGSDSYTFNELSHAACRAVMALAVFLQEEYTASRVPTGLAIQPKED